MNAYKTLATQVMGVELVITVVTSILWALRLNLRC
jgi:hypothetical protein